MASLGTLYQDTKVAGEENQVWTACGVNPWFRFCKHKPGDDFKPRLDSCRLASVQSQSFMTVNIYLNTVDDGHGGATRVLKVDSSTPKREHTTLSAGSN